MTVVIRVQSEAITDVGNGVARKEKNNNDNKITEMGEE